MNAFHLSPLYFHFLIFAKVHPELLPRLAGPSENHVHRSKAHIKPVFSTWIFHVTSFRKVFNLFSSGHTEGMQQFGELLLFLGGVACAGSGFSKISLIFLLIGPFSSLKKRSINFVRCLKTYRILIEIKGLQYVQSWYDKTIIASVFQWNTDHATIFQLCFSNYDNYYAQRKLSPCRKTSMIYWTNILL